MPNDREVAGIRCTKVLEHLSGYLDGEIEDELLERIEEHLRGCNWCEAFGREFATTIKRLRARLKRPNEMDPDLAERLMHRLEMNIQ